MTDEAIDACKKQSVEPSELINKPVEDFFDIELLKKGKINAEQEELAYVRSNHF